MRLHEIEDTNGVDKVINHALSKAYTKYRPGVDVAGLVRVNLSQTFSVLRTSPEIQKKILDIPDEQLVIMFDKFSDDQENRRERTRELMKFAPTYADLEKYKTSSAVIDEWIKRYSSEWSKEELFDVLLKSVVGRYEDPLYIRDAVNRSFLGASSPKPQTQTRASIEDVMVELGREFRIAAGKNMRATEKLTAGKVLQHTKDELKNQYKGDSVKIRHLDSISTGEFFKWYNANKDRYKK